MMKKNIANKAFLYSLISLLCIGLCFFFFKRAEKETIFGDIYVFWRAGNFLLEGKDIYFTPDGQRGFIYPPFAALFFIPLSLFPFKIAVFLFFIINCFAWFYTFVITKKILTLCRLNPNTIKWALFIGFILSFKLCWNNLMTIQVNQIVFLFSIISIYFFLIKKEFLSIFFLSIAISLKIIPIFLAFWIIIRGNKKNIFYFLGFGAVAILLPFTFQGFSFGMEQLVSYFNDFILKFASGDQVILSYANQSLKPTLLRIFSASREYPQPFFTIIDFGEKVANRFSAICLVSFFLITLIALIYRKISRYDLNVLEPMSLVVLSHLFSGITWKAHLTSSVFFYSVFAAMLISNLKKELILNTLEKFNLILFLIFATLISFLGKEIIGKDGQLWIGGLGGYTWQLVFILIFSLFWIFRRKSSALL